MRRPPREGSYTRGDNLKFAMHNWMRAEPIETTIERLGRCGYDAIEISGEPAVWDTDEVQRADGQARHRLLGAR